MRMRVTTFAIVGLLIFGIGVWLRLDAKRLATNTAFGGGSFKMTQVDDHRYAAYRDVSLASLGLGGAILIVSTIHFLRRKDGGLQNA